MSKEHQRAPHVVLVAGLGAPTYLRSLADALSLRGARCSLLDIPGFGRRGPLVCEPTITGIGRAVAARLVDLDDERVVLFGHSTGGQAALRASVEAERRRPLAALVLAGTTVAPTQRSLRRLALAAPAAFRRDSPRELAVLRDLVRAGPALVPLLRSALEDRPEVGVAQLRSALTVTAGRGDTFAPLWWQRVLVAGAAQSVRTAQVTLPGSHNNPFTHPGEMADLVLSASCGAGRTR